MVDEDISERRDSEKGNGDTLLALRRQQRDRGDRDCVGHTARPPKREPHAERCPAPSPRRRASARVVQTPSPRSVPSASIAVTVDANTNRPNGASPSTAAAARVTSMSAAPFQAQRERLQGEVPERVPQRGPGRHRALSPERAHGIAQDRPTPCAAECAIEGEAPVAHVLEVDAQPLGHGSDCPRRSFTWAQPVMPGRTECRAA